MAQVFFDTITNPSQVRAAFSYLDHDYYPYEVYEYILYTLQDINDEDYAELDPIAWCDIIQEAEPKDYAVNTIDELVAELGRGGYTVIGSNADVVYYV